jgi:membrane associated rhomboid family serine protease
MYLTYIIMGVTIVVSFMAFNNPEVMSKLILNPYRVNRDKEYYRFITSGFIHNDHMHLIFNMFSFYFFGTAVEMVFRGVFGKGKGALYYILLYVLAIIISDLPSYLKQRNNPLYNSLGASGGVAAVVFGFILFLPLQEICIYFALCLPGVLFGSLYVAYSWYQGRNANDNINHDAHLYGAAFGFIFCLILYPPAFGQFLEQIGRWRLFN